jgi:hypothetical protein
MTTTLIRRIFGGASAPATDTAIPVGHHSGVPKFIVGYREVEARLKLRPIVIRSTRHRQPAPAEQGAIGLQSDCDFRPPTAPLVAPKVARGLAVVDAPPPMHRPYSLESDEQATADCKSSAAMWVQPYGLSGRDLSG